MWARALCLAMLVAVLGACATQRPDADHEKKPKIQLLWPEPPEQPRFQYQMVLRSPADIRVETDKERLERILTGRGFSEEAVYERATSIAATGGRIYVADSPRQSVVVFDVARRTLFRFGLREPHVLNRPTSVATDARGLVYVLDTKLLKVMVFDALGLYQFSVGDKADFTKPVGLAVSQDGERIYVVDRGSLNGDDHRVLIFAPDGRKLRELGPRGSEPGRFNIPLEAAVAPDGELVVLDSGNFRVQVFDREGNFRRSFGSVGNFAGQFARPRDVAVDGDGNIYVSDASFNNVQVFDREGRLLLAIGGADLRGMPGGFALIGALAADEKGFVYIGDNYFKKIEVYRRLSDAEGLALRNKE